MKRNILLGSYTGREFFWRRADARVKLFLALSLILWLWWKPSGLPWLAAFSTLVAVLYIGGGPAWGELWAALRAWRWLLLLTAVFNVLPLIRFEKASFYILAGLFQVWRLTLTLWIALWLNRSTRPLQLIAGFVSLLKPLRGMGLPVDSIALVMGLTLRFFPLMLEESEKIITAQKIRGVDFRRGGLKQKWLALNALIVPLLIGMIRRADHLALAIEARGYRVGQPRTYYMERKMAASDWAILGAAVLLWAVMLWPCKPGTL
ncbi:MAG: energy-coupling factor transporter transmembrane component T family protein [Bacillota bacterium]